MHFLPVLNRFCLRCLRESVSGVTGHRSRGTPKHESGMPSSIGLVCLRAIALGTPRIGPGGPDQLIMVCMHFFPVHNRVFFRGLPRIGLGDGRNAFLSVAADAILG